MKYFIALGATIGLLSACATYNPFTPIKPRLSSEDCQSVREPPNVNQIIHNHLEVSLRDYSNTAVKIEKGRPDAVLTPQGKYACGWVVEVWVNAKDDYGDYIGFRPGYAHFVNDSFVELNFP